MDDIEVESIDGFLLGNKFFHSVSSLYDPLAVKLPGLWDACYKMADVATRPINFVISKFIAKKLLACIEEKKPDMIVTLHPAFVGSALNVLEKENLQIPVVTFIADLDNVSALWGDRRAHCILCPTEEAKRRMLELGMDELRLKVVGFPVRKDFCNPALPEPPDVDASRGGVSVLMINGSQGLKNVTDAAKSVLSVDGCHVSVITGNNAALKKSLETSLLPEYSDRAEIHGFIRDIAGFMSKADILIIRASPNVMMEAVNLCRPIIVVGALSGQEKMNPAFAARNRLALNCEDITKLPELISGMLSDGGATMKELYEGQAAFRRPLASLEIAEFLADLSRTVKFKSVKVSDGHEGSHANSRAVTSEGLNRE